jgi:hypothetical protein
MLDLVLVLNVTSASRQIGWFCRGFICLCLDVIRFCCLSAVFANRAFIASVPVPFNAFFMVLMQFQTLLFTNGKTENWSTGGLETWLN